ncbi:MAG: hypothetical protein WDZ62_01075 [Candidatus Pacearchaeota archaeon]
MINKNEIYSILLVIGILTLSLGIFQDLASFFWIFLAVLLVITINSLAKKIMAFYLESEIEFKIWEIHRFGFKPKNHFKKPFRAGAFIPLITSVITFGNFVWLSSLIFDIKPKIYRSAKRHGLYSFSEITEDHIGFIAAAGVFANLVFAIIGYLIGFEEFSKINIYLAFFNMIPLSDLDGNKIFFGNITLWIFLTTLTLLGLGFAFFII